MSIPEIQANYSGFQGQFAVEFSNLTGFDALEEKIIALAADSPALRAVWPPLWLHARDRIREKGVEIPYMTPQEFARLMRNCDIEPTQQHDLSEQLHQLGNL